MPELSKDLISILQYLLPGFLVAWICYGLTSHQKPIQFERVVQALIYALFVHFFVILLHKFLLSIGKYKNLGYWDSDAELIASLCVAIFIGIAFSFLMNSDKAHRIFRKFGLSTRSSHPSEWCTAFDSKKQFVVVHFKDERRLYGWPHIWPSDPSKGHLFLAQATWILDDTAQGGAEDEIEILVNVVDVKWIEFIKEQPA
jgi:hypothetical protein